MLINFLLIFLISAVNIAAQTTIQTKEWSDKSPHKSGFATVGGIKLHYLDWGGKGEPLLFLAGTANTAHIFDDVAPKFSDRFRVLGLTRRGHGQSDAPADGYDIPTLVEDIRQFLDAMKIKRVNLVGHSLAGDEMTKFAELYPERVNKLVYLDAAYNRAELLSIMVKAPRVQSAPVSPQDLAVFEGLRNVTKKAFGFWSDAQEADLRETSLGADGKVKSPVSAQTMSGLFKALQESRFDYSKVKSPALAFYATVKNPVFPPETDEASRQKTLTYMKEQYIPYLNRQIERFKTEVAGGRVVELPDANHFLFIQRQDEVVREMRKFLLNKRIKMKP